jgi:hypothetical protein
MTESPIPYKRLPGTGRGLGSYVTLWAAPDHVLMVRASSFGERYKRFYFRDIQAIFLRPTPRGFWSRIVFGILAAAGVAGAIATSDGIAGTLWFVAAVLGALLIADFLKGPTCACFVKTAVQMERLGSLTRTRKAERVLARLRPLIRQAQEVGED